MQLYFDAVLPNGYRNQSQQIRVLTETWMERNGYCLRCSNKSIKELTNNKPVADLFCPQCSEEYELKGKKQNTVGKIAPDDAYRTMLERIQSDTNPNFFSPAYKKADYSAQQSMLVPRHFITADMIVLCKKSISNRPDYTMCSVNIALPPESGKILLIDKARTIEFEIVLKQRQTDLFLRGQKVEKKG